MFERRLAFLGGGLEGAEITAKAACLGELAVLPLEVVAVECYEVTPGWNVESHIDRSTPLR